MSATEKHVWTIQLPKRALAERRYITVVDTTVKTGIAAFGPTWNMVWGIKNGHLSEEEYRGEYIKLMRQTWRTHREQWESVLDLDYFALACYCKPGAFCHRHFVKEAIVLLLKQRHFKVHEHGELTD